MNEHITKQQLFEYFAGKATALEKQHIETWSRSPIHEEHYFACLDEWEQAHLQYTPDHAAALSRYRDFLYADELSPLHAEPVTQSVNLASPGSVLNRLIGFKPNPARWLVWAVAASVAVVALLIGTQDQLLTRTYTTAYGETRRLTLPDGSNVTLNANSSLKLPRFGFGSTTRDVWLTGEALFSVTHTANHQRFVIKTSNNHEVVVLGTEFTVFARPRGTKVALSRGKVEVHYRLPNRQSRQLTMKPGDLVVLSPQGVVRQQQTKTALAHPAWTDHHFVFDQTPLTEVVAMLRETYGLTVEIAEAETGQLTLTGAYPAQTGTELIQIIGEVLDLQLVHQPDKTILIQKPVQ